jgi:hypothetical protein
MTSACPAHVLFVVAPLSVVECLGCQTIYKKKSDQEQHEAAFLCGPAKVMSLSPFADLPLACSREKPVPMRQRSSRPTRPVSDKGLGPDVQILTTTTSSAARKVGE